MELTIDRKAYAEDLGLPEEELDPWPQIAPAINGVQSMFYRMMFPTNGPPSRVSEDGWMRAEFQIDDGLVCDGAMIRYGEHPGRYYPLGDLIYAPPHPGASFAIYARISHLK